MGRISDVIPPLYFTGKNDLKGFLDALDAEIDGLEAKVRGITSLIDVDRCPDDKLPYLAALTNCPLVGEDPKYWRRQIRSWPYLLKLKGTERSLALALESIGADSYEIRTFFRDAGGGYVTQRPEGEPFKNQVNGLWYNIRTHYFGVELKVSEEFVKVQDYNWDVDKLRAQLAPWIERAKPFHAELLGLVITPPDFLPPDHICRWDVCTWEHAEMKEYGWGNFDGAELVDTDSQFTRRFDRPLLVLDTPFWDMLSWDSLLYSPRLAGRLSVTGVLGSLDEDSEADILYPLFWDGSRWDYAMHLQRTFGRFSLTGVSCDSRLDDTPPLSGAFSVTALLSSLYGWTWRRVWVDCPTWEDVAEDQNPHTETGRIIIPAFSCDSELGVGNLERRYTNWAYFRAWDSASTWEDASRVQLSEVDIWKEELLSA